MWLDSRTLARARAALAVGVQQYISDSNVQLVDLGYRIREREDGRLIEEAAVRFHVGEKLRGPRFEAFAAEQPERVIPSSILSFPTDVIESKYSLHFVFGGMATKPHRTASINPRAGASQPMLGGISISDSYANGYATLGSLVVDRQSGDAMILSNFHVLASRGFARPGTPILQPGRGDGGAETVATFDRHAMNRGLDAAVARLNGSRALVNNQVDLRPITGIAAPQLGMRLCKSGRASGVTHGLVSGIGGVLKMSYPVSGERLIRDVAHIVPIFDGGVVSAPGDSGSCWLDTATYQAVGLHFAGADDPEYALALDMQQVADALNIQFPTG